MRRKGVIGWRNWTMVANFARWSSCPCDLGFETLAGKERTQLMSLHLYPMPVPYLPEKPPLIPSVIVAMIIDFYLFLNCLYFSFLH
jgi:hypothetical protein